MVSHLLLIYPLIFRAAYADVRRDLVFSKAFFRGWVVVLFLWAFYASGTITLLPIWEGRKSIVSFFGYIAKGRVARKPNTVMLEGSPVLVTSDTEGVNETRLDEKK